uniref:Uncharacterized protein n=1 Tax=Arion vulgaris TaxID=1028688 RepID=A0A0B7BGL9_9EUPU
MGRSSTSVWAVITREKVMRYQRERDIKKRMNKASISICSLLSLKVGLFRHEAIRIFSRDISKIFSISTKDGHGQSTVLTLFLTMLLTLSIIVYHSLLCSP